MSLLTQEDFEGLADVPLGYCTREWDPSMGISPAGAVEELGIAYAAALARIAEQAKENESLKAKQETE